MTSQVVIVLNKVAHLWSSKFNDKLPNNENQIQKKEKINLYNSPNCIFLIFVVPLYYDSVCIDGKNEIFENAYGNLTVIKGIDFGPQTWSPEIPSKVIDWGVDGEAPLLDNRKRFMVTGGATSRASDRTTLGLRATMAWTTEGSLVMRAILTFLFFRVIFFKAQASKDPCLKIKKERIFRKNIVRIKKANIMDRDFSHLSATHG